jgi:hypothetical protein
VRLKEENKEEKKENKASLASVAKLTKAAGQNKKGFDQNSLTIAKMKLDIASKRERIKSLSDEVAELKKRNKAEQKEESREENVAAKEATKQAKRSAFKVHAATVQHMQAQALSMFLPSVLSAFLQGPGTSPYAFSPPGMSVWQQHQHQHQHQQHQHQQFDPQAVLQQLAQQAQQLQQMQQAQQQQQQHREMRASPSPDEYAHVPWDNSSPQRTSPPISVSTPESARQRHRQLKRERDEEVVSDDNSDGPVGPPHSSASK